MLSGSCSSTLTLTSLACWMIVCRHLTWCVSVASGWRCWSSTRRLGDHELYHEVEASSRIFIVSCPSVGGGWKNSSIGSVASSQCILKCMFPVLSSFQATSDPPKACGENGQSYQRPDSQHNGTGHQHYQRILREGQRTCRSAGKERALFQRPTAKLCWKKFHKSRHCSGGDGHQVFGHSLQQGQGSSDQFHGEETPIPDLWKGPQC